MTVANLRTTRKRPLGANTLRKRVLDTLAGSPMALSVTDLVGKLRTQRASTIARALRALREEGAVAADKMPGGKNGVKHWWAVSSPKVYPGHRPTVVTQTALNLQPQGPIMTLSDAVETIINEWVIAQKTFSAHDVTVELRARVAGGTINLDVAAAGTVNVAGVDVARVVHTDVRDAVHAMSSAGQILGYDRSHNGQYWVYGPQLTATPPSSAPAGSSSDDYDGSPSL